MNGVPVRNVYPDATKSPRRPRSPRGSVTVNLVLSNSLKESPAQKRQGGLALSVRTWRGATLSAPAIQSAAYAFGGRPHGFGSKPADRMLSLPFCSRLAIAADRKSQNPEGGP